MAELSRYGARERAREEVEVRILRSYFDSAFYRSKNEDLAAIADDDLVTHYVRHGWLQGRNPTPEFRTRQYLIEFPDVAAARINPFLHYILAGQAEGRLLHEARRDHQLARLSDVELVVSRRFDAVFYLTSYADVAEAMVNPVQHYCSYGWKEGRDPSPVFSTTGYLVSNPDVAEAGVNPFWHFLVAGEAEGRRWQQPNLALQPLAAHPEGERLLREIAVVRDFFDTNFYLGRNADVAAAHVDALEHFMTHGWGEGRDPSPWFSVPYYLDANPDVRKAKVNPFWHFIVAGKAEGRLAQHPGGSKAAKLLRLRPLEDVVKEWRTRPQPSEMLTAKDIRRQVRRLVHGKRGELVISISHDNYRDVSGGIQTCIQQEETAASSRGVVYLNLHPYQPLPRLVNADEDADPTVALLLSGEMIGTAPMSAVISAASRFAADGIAARTVIHQLLGHSTERVEELIHSTGATDCWFWLHDFFSLCPSYALQRNNVSFCGAPSPGSNACSLCLFGAERMPHLERMQSLFESIDVHAVAPSSFMAEYWSSKTRLPTASLSTHPHMSVAWHRSEKRRALKQGRISIAYIGYPIDYKGWTVFERLVKEAQPHGIEYEFLYFGVGTVTVSGVETVRAQVTKDDPSAMVSAIRGRDVDFVLHWAAVAETFSFSTFEAMAGGARVLTNPWSGNVQATVRATKEGHVFSDEADLFAAFSDGRIQVMADQRRNFCRSHDASISRSEMIFSAFRESART